MRRVLPRTFFAQLVLSTVLVQTVFLGVYIVYIVVSQRHLAQERSRVRMDQQLRRLSNALAGPLAHGDVAAVHDVLNIAEIAPSIQAARLTDQAGRTLAVSDQGAPRGLDPAELAELPRSGVPHIFVNNGQLEGVAPVDVDNKPDAVLWLEPVPTATGTASTVVRIGFSYGIFALLANLLPIFLIVRTMTQPLRTLNDATRHVIRGTDPPRGFPLPVTTRNEAGKLTVSFNTMVRELEMQRSGLLETLALLDSMLGNAPIGFAFFDEELHHVRLNQYMADLYGAAAGVPLRRRATEVQPGELAEAMEERIGSVFATGTPVRDVELSSPEPNVPGGRRVWLMHFYPVHTQPGIVRWVGVVAVEISDRLQAEETLRKTEKLAAAGRLAASVAHEINNPLEAVINLLYLLEVHDALDPVARGYVTMAQAELARVSGITQQTLRFYRQTASPGQTNLPEVLDAITSLYRARILGASVTVERRYHGTPELMAFTGEIRQLFANLITNAVDAMHSGGTLYMRAWNGHGMAAGSRWTHGIHVTVADTGCGMSAATRAKIFEAFFTTKQATGTGLGLWVSDEIVRKHFGRVSVKSRQATAGGQHGGTCFHVFLPDQPNPQPAAVDAALVQQ